MNNSGITYFFVAVALSSLLLTPNNDFFDLIYWFLSDLYVKLFSVIFICMFLYGTINHCIDKYNWNTYTNNKITLQEMDEINK